ncbi:MAG: 2-oxo acid dehydrogenase subunit E2 [Ardenticatenaceae bacterium]|nr:2-oxo acid dehydrogenase subunit E2 [Ardenticatenaceae bacterium]
MVEFTMPSLGADMESGVLYDWQVKPGDTVKRGDIVASVETDKGVIDIEVFTDGVVDQLLVAEGTRVPVGTVLALIRGEGEEPVAMAEAAPAPAVEAHPMDQRPLLQPPPIQPKPTHNGGGRQRVSPAARKLASELGIDLTILKGSGPGGAISLADVEAVPKPVAAPEVAVIQASPVARRLAQALGVDLHIIKGSGPNGTICRGDVEKRAAELIRQAKTAVPTKAKPVRETAVPTTTPSSPTTDFQAGMRRAIAAAMSRANREIPHYYLETQIDMSRALQWLEAENLKRSIKERLLPVVLLIKATAKALGDVPQLNGYWQEDQLQVQEAIHLGFAIALRQGGLVTPAIHQADTLTLDEVMVELRDLITRTRSGRLRSSDLTDATVTLTSLGDTGVEKVYGVIYPPQVALVGFGKIREQPWAQNGMIGIRQVVTATLAGDHRATDGRIGAQFLVNLEKYLQEPEKL